MGKKAKNKKKRQKGHRGAQIVAEERNRKKLKEQQAAYAKELEARKAAAKTSSPLVPGLTMGPYMATLTMRQAECVMREMADFGLLDDYSGLS